MKIFRTLILFVFGLCLLSLWGCAPREERVVVYTSQDQVYAEPVLNSFAKKFQYQVNSLFDSEAVKTVGIANRLLAERSASKADVFWNNEEYRTRLLARENVFDPKRGWSAFGYRRRQLVVHSNALDQAVYPKSFREFASSQWKGKIALAYPLFGTTSTHFLLLRQRWGHSEWIAWCRQLQANNPFLAEGNSAVVRFVARGDAVIGITDSDDIRAGQREGLPVHAIDLPEEEQFFIQNSVAIVRGAGNPEGAERLRDFLTSPPVLQDLVKRGAIDGTAAPAEIPDEVWSRMVAEHEPAVEELRQVFHR